MWIYCLQTLHHGWQLWYRSTLDTGPSPVWSSQGPARHAASPAVTACPAWVGANHGLTVTAHIRVHVAALKGVWT